jgi:hypothetical protein
MWYETKSISNSVEYFQQYATNKFEEREYEGRAKFIETFKDKIERFYFASITAPYDIIYFNSKGNKNIVEVKLRTRKLDYLIKNKPILDYAKFVKLKELSKLNNVGAYFAILTNDNYWLIINVGAREVKNICYTDMITKKCNEYDKGYELSELVKFDIDNRIDFIFDIYGEKYDYYKR